MLLRPVGWTSSPSIGARQNSAMAPLALAHERVEAAGGVAVPDQGEPGILRRRSCGTRAPRPPCDRHAPAARRRPRRGARAGSAALRPAPAPRGSFLERPRNAGAVLRSSVCARMPCFRAFCAARVRRRASPPRATSRRSSGSHRHRGLSGPRSFDTRAAPRARRLTRDIRVFSRPQAYPCGQPAPQNQEIHHSQQTHYRHCP